MLGFLVDNSDYQDAVMEPLPNPEEDLKTLSIQLANQIINVANSHLEEGMRVDAIAAGLRHAAANFSAFAHHTEGGDEDKLTPIVEDFLQMFEYYLERHAPKQSQPGGGLSDLIEQAKKEV